MHGVLFPYIVCAWCTVHVVQMWRATRRASIWDCDPDKALVTWCRGSWVAEFGLSRGSRVAGLRPRATPPTLRPRANAFAGLALAAWHRRTGSSWERGTPHRERGTAAPAAPSLPPLGPTRCRVVSPGLSADKFFIEAQCSAPASVKLCMDRSARLHSWVLEGSAVYEILEVG